MRYGIFASLVDCACMVDSAAVVVMSPWLLSFMVDFDAMVVSVSMVDCAFLIDWT